MATRVVASLLVSGSAVVARAVAQAFSKAVANAQRSGVAQETLQNVITSKTSKAMTEHEARQILGVSATAAWADVLAKYETLFENNVKRGSFYLQSKVVRAKERLEAAKPQSRPFTNL